MTEDELYDILKYYCDRHKITGLTSYTQSNNMLKYILNYSGIDKGQLILCNFSNGAEILSIHVEGHAYSNHECISFTSIISYYNRKKILNTLLE